MALHRPDNLKALAINIALAVTLIGSLALVVWGRVTAARTDDLLEQAIEAGSAGDISAFAGYRESANILFQLYQVQQPWLYAAYFGVALALVAVLSRWMAKVRTPTP